MRFRATTVAVTAAATLLVLPLTPAQAAVPTTSTVVAYIADTDGNRRGELWTRAADGSGDPTQIFPSSTSPRWLPALSPDGTKVAFLQGFGPEDERVYRLYVGNTNGTGTPTLIADADVLSPSWSADGTQLVYFRWNPATFTYGIYREPADGTGAATLVPTTDEHFSIEPAFSPSGRQVAMPVFGDTTPDSLGIHLVTLATGARSLVPGTEGGEDPVWSPDGKYLLFQKLLSSCGVGLYRVPVGGGTATPFRIVANRFLGSAEYSRDGSQVFFTDAPWDCGSTAKGDIWVVDADGSNPQNVTATSGVYEHSTSVAGGTPLPADTTAPTAPVIKPAGEVSATTARIWWTGDAESVEFAVVRVAKDAAAPATPAEGTPVYQGGAETAVATGLATGTEHDLYVFAYDAFGNVSPASAKHTVRTVPAPFAHSLPTIGRQTQGTAFTFQWSSAAAAFDVQVGQKTRNSSGTWSRSPVYTTVAAATAAKQYAMTGVQGRTHYLRVRAHDGHGNVTAFTAAREAHVPLDDRWSGLSVSRGWAAKTSAARYLGTYRTTITPGAALSARVDTRRFVIIGDKCATCGQFKVYVDGVLKATVDTKASTTLTRRVLWAGGYYSSIKPHSIKIVAVGTKGRPRVSIDGLGLTR